jgi:outer membrane protein assembly factor BamB
LAYVTDAQHFIRCIDQATGEEVWSHDAGGEFWASAMVADGKVYAGTRNGQFWILKAGRTKAVLSHTDLGAPINSTAVAANQTLYVATSKQLYAFHQ